MGADLYIAKLDREDQYTGFKTDVNAGYFRDAYNNSNLLWQFNLNYWVKMKKYLNKDHNMTPANAKKLLIELKKREVIFEKNLEALLKKENEYWDYEVTDWSKGTKKHKPSDMSMKDRKEWVKYYREKYQEFKKFLKLAIKLNSKILFSA